MTWAEKTASTLSSPQGRELRKEVDHPSLEAEPASFLDHAVVQVHADRAHA